MDGGKLCDLGGGGNSTGFRKKDSGVACSIDILDTLGVNETGTDDGSR